MRSFEFLDHVSIAEDTGIISFSSQEDMEACPMMTLRREGSYMAISACYGPLEVALRPRLEELTRLLARLQPVEGLQTTRQVGTAQAYLAVGLRADGVLLLRPTIVADATGHLALNFGLTDASRAKLFEWLQVGKEAAG